MRTAILKLMEKNSRIDFQDVADMLDTDLETVKKTVKEMEDEHIICGYHTLINWDKEEEERVCHFAINHLSLPSILISKIGILVYKVTTERWKKNYLATKQKLL